MFRQLFKYNKDIGHSYVENLNTRVMHENGGYFLKTNSTNFQSSILSISIDCSCGKT